MDQPIVMTRKERRLLGCEPPEPPEISKASPETTQELTPELTDFNAVVSWLEEGKDIPPAEAEGVIQGLKGLSFDEEIQLAKIYDEIVRADRLKLEASHVGADSLLPDAQLPEKSRKARAILRGTAFFSTAIFISSGLALLLMGWG